MGGPPISFKNVVKSEHIPGQIAWMQKTARFSKKKAKIVLETLEADVNYVHSNKANIPKSKL